MNGIPINDTHIYYNVLTLEQVITKLFSPRSMHPSKSKSVIADDTSVQNDNFQLLYSHGAHLIPKYLSMIKFCNRGLDAQIFFLKFDTMQICSKSFLVHEIRIIHMLTSNQRILAIHIALSASKDVHHEINHICKRST